MIMLGKYILPKQGFPYLYFDLDHRDNRDSMPRKEAIARYGRPFLAEGNPYTSGFGRTTYP